MLRPFLNNASCTGLFSFKLKAAFCLCALLNALNCTWPVVGYNSHEIRPPTKFYLTNPVQSPSSQNVMLYNLFI